MSKRLMPERIKLGDHMQSTILAAFHSWENAEEDKHGRRTVMGFYLPPWQRGLVWTEAQKVKLLESAWLGLNIGTYTINHSKDHGGILDNILIDGQQRMSALQDYFENRFPVFGHYWEDLGKPERRGFLIGTHFSSYITKSEDEAYLRNYYNLMNFGGVAHKESERA